MADLCLIESQSVFRVEGADARAFLQSQLTNDVEALSETASHLSAWCDPKGRVQVLFRVLRQGDDILLLAPTEVVLSLLPRLKMFVLRRKVSIAQDDTYAINALSGDDADTALAHHGIAPPAPGEVVNHESVLVVGTHAGWLLTGPASALSDLTDALEAAGAQRRGESAWKDACIAAGIPTIDAAAQGEYVPQMLNLDRLDGISFDKGCYPGQEIVARTQYLGRIGVLWPQPRRM